MNAPRSKAETVRVFGPMESFAEGFRLSLLDAGYTPLSAVVQLRLMAHASRWLESQQIPLRDFTTQRVTEFITGRHKAGYTGLYTSEAMVPMLQFLRGHGAVPMSVAFVPDSAAEVLLASFHRYLLHERGLAASTAAAYVARARRFLTGSVGEGEIGYLSAAMVTRAVLDESQTRCVGSVQFFVVAVRAFVKFCRLEGLVDVDLTAAAPSITGRRALELPQGLSPDDAAALLEACDRDEVIGLRDYAVLLILLRLGLRAGEVARLRLEDINWRTGQVVVRGKGSRLESLPWPADVGAAVAHYLQHARPDTNFREVFVTVCAPRVALQRESVSLIVRRSCVRAGIAPIGAHRLRHALARDMVAAGASLPEIGQVLRHHHLSSTAIYARVDLPQLRLLAQSWPGVGTR